MSTLARRSALVIVPVVGLAVAFLAPEPKAQATPPVPAAVGSNPGLPAPFTIPVFPPAPPLAATAPKHRPRDEGSGCGKTFHTPFDGKLALRAAYRTARPKVYQFCPSWSGFGNVRGGHKNHGGIDISAPTGTAVRAGVDGQLTYARDPGGYGTFARVRFAHPKRAKDGTCGGAGEVEIIYAHLQPEGIKVGAPPRHVRVGEIIGKVGCSGNAKGMCSPSPESHLHVTVQRTEGGKSRLDPVAFLGWNVHKPDDSERAGDVISCGSSPPP